MLDGWEKARADDRQVRSAVLASGKVLLQDAFPEYGPTEDEDSQDFTSEGVGVDYTEVELENPGGLDEYMALMELMASSRTVSVKTSEMSVEEDGEEALGGVDMEWV